MHHLIEGLLAWTGLVGLGLVDHADQSEILKQPSSQLPPEQLLRPLVWGDVNVIHTTDTHGWLPGHLLEPNFGADWGDFVSFSKHMRDLADQKNTDLIIVDTGDRHDGNGFSDASSPDGKYSEETFSYADFDLVTVGNHELYRAEATLQEFETLRVAFGDRFVTSNVDIRLDDDWVPLGNKYRNFTLSSGRSVLGLGFLFNFAGNDKIASKVTRVEKEIQKPWFKDLLADLAAFDLVVIAGHIPIREPEFEALYTALRLAHPEIPILMFGGHSHIRDFKVYDDRAVALESGRYCETVGFLGANITDKPEFSRSYIDFNVRNLAAHSDKTLETFGTKKGRHISKEIASVRKQLDLDKPIAWVGQTYYTDRAAFPSKDSIFSLLQDHVLNLLTPDNFERPHPRYTILNTGAVRFDMFKGVYTTDSAYIISPFNNKWVFLPDLPKAVADQLLPFLNREDKVIAALTRESSQVRDSSPPSAASVNKTLGYHTIDDLGDTGDDTVHTPWVFHHLPNAFQAELNVTSDTKRVDVVFHDFLAPFIAKALKATGHQEAYRPKYFGKTKVTDLIPQYLNALGQDATARVQAVGYNYV